jgi:RNA polymerase sigma-70 factor, ECF subfamily
MPEQYQAAHTATHGKDQGQKVSRSKSCVSGLADNPVFFRQADGLFSSKRLGCVETRRKRAGELIRANIRSVGIPPDCVEMIVRNEAQVSGNRQQIIELYDHVRPSLHAYLSVQGLSREHSEDVIQEAFLRLVRHVVSCGPNTNPRAWVFRVAHNLSMDHHRTEKRQARPSEAESHVILREHVDPAPDPEQTILLRERFRRFREAVGQLTPKQRHCLLLRAKGLRYREIAGLMGVSVQRIGELMQRVTSLIESGVAGR